jgi:exopolysaccharide production protein ExoY
MAERLCAGTILVATLPVLAFSALLIVILSKRSPLVAHQRVGQGGVPIWVLKLRTMWDRKPGQANLTGLIERVVADVDCPPQPKGKIDPRVTSRLAGFCRRYSIDELPQLWHVLKGEMALLGPRPLTAGEIQKYYGAAALELLAVKPGLTGLWQTTGRSRRTYLQRRRLDLFMIRNWSAGLYVRILFKTIPAVLTGKDAW